jgi:hypothetical protein
MNWYNLAADLLVAVHVAYVAYVVLGQAVIVVAAARHWQWARNPWFRFTHLLAIGIVALEAVMHWRCPLSVWEEQLRTAGGVAFHAGETFMGRLLHSVLFIDGMPESFFTACYVGVMLLVLQGLIMYPPRWFRRSPMFRA